MRNALTFRDGRNRCRSRGEPSHSIRFAMTCNDLRARQHLECGALAPLFSGLVQSDSTRFKPFQGYSSLFNPFQGYSRLKIKIIFYFGFSHKKPRVAGSLRKVYHVPRGYGSPPGGRVRGKRRSPWTAATRRRPALRDANRRAHSKAFGI